MKKLITFIPLAVILQTVCAQPIKNSLTEMHLKGKVKEMDVSYFGGMNNPDTLSLTRKVVFLFDATGNEIEEKENEYSKDGNSTTKTVFVYNPKGENVESDYIDSVRDWTIKNILKYDDNNRCIESGTYYDDNEISKILFKYDSAGRKIEEDTYRNRENLNQLTGKIVLKYGNNDNLTEQNLYLSTNGFTEKRTFEYNNDGLEIKSSLYNKINKLIETNETNYVELDSNGNWLKEIVKHYQYVYGKGDSSNTFILKREVIYY